MRKLSRSIVQQPAFCLPVHAWLEIYLTAIASYSNGYSFIPHGISETPTEEQDYLASVPTRHLFAGRYDTNRALDVTLLKLIPTGHIHGPLDTLCVEDENGVAVTICKKNRIISSSRHPSRINIHSIDTWTFRDFSQRIQRFPPRALLRPSYLDRLESAALLSLLPWGWHIVSVIVHESV